MSSSGDRVRWCRTEIRQIFASNFCTNELCGVCARWCPNNETKRANFTITRVKLSNNTRKSQEKSFKSSGARFSRKLSLKFGIFLYFTTVNRQNPRCCMFWGPCVSPKYRDTLETQHLKSPVPVRVTTEKVFFGTQFRASGWAEHPRAHDFRALQAYALLKRFSASPGIATRAKNCARVSIRLQ